MVYICLDHLPPHNFLPWSTASYLASLLQLQSNNNLTVTLCLGLIGLTHILTKVCWRGPAVGTIFLFPPLPTPSAVFKPVIYSITFSHTIFISVVVPPPPLPPLTPPPSLAPASDTIGMSPCHISS